MKQTLVRVLLFLALVPLVLVLLFLAVGLLASLSLGLLPMVMCQRYKAVRRLVTVSLAYYPVLAVLLNVVFGLPWWLILVLVVPAFLYTALLPDPWTYFMRPRDRGAVLRAIESLERNGLAPVDYHTARVVGTEAGLTLVVLRGPVVEGPPRMHYLVVGKDGAVEPLSPLEQRERFGYDPEDDAEAIG